MSGLILYFLVSREVCIKESDHSVHVSCLGINSNVR